MITIISRSKRVNVEKFSLAYRWKDANGRATGAGFGFPCDRTGNLLMDEIEGPGLENLQKCQDGTYDVVYQGVVRAAWHYVEPAVGRCHCGAEVCLDSDDNECEACGRLYNMSGQELLPRDQWEESDDYLDEEVGPRY